MKKYTISMQVEGPFASFKDPMSGSESRSYPAPTYSAVKGMFESVLFLRHAEVVPTKVHICRPIRYTNYSTVYSNPALGKTATLKKGNSARIKRLVLFDVVYQLFAEVRSLQKGGINHAHSYQAQFNRRLKRGSSYRPVTLGLSEFAVDSFGPVDQQLEPKPINLTIPVMVKRIFDRQFGEYKPEFEGNVQIEQGVLEYVK